MNGVEFKFIPKIRRSIVVLLMLALVAIFPSCGDDSVDETIDVIYSDWIEAETDDWVIESANQVHYTYSSSDFTSSVKNQAMVNCYYRNGDDVNEVVYQIPLEFGNGNIFRYYLDEGQIRFYISNSNGISAPASAFYRYVIVPGNVNAGGRLGSTIDWSNYEEVIQYYGINR